MSKTTLYLILNLLTIFFCKQEQYRTNVTFYVEYEYPKNQELAITIFISEKGHNLTNVIQKINTSQKYLTQIAYNFNTSILKAHNIQDVSILSDHHHQFQLSKHLTIQNVQKKLVAQLVDTIVKEKGELNINIVGIVEALRKSENFEKNQNKIVKQNAQKKGKRICQQILKMSRFQVITFDEVNQSISASTTQNLENQTLFRGSYDQALDQIYRQQESELFYDQNKFFKVEVICYGSQRQKNISQNKQSKGKKKINRINYQKFKQFKSNESIQIYK